MLNIIGLFNVISNNSQIKEMNKTIEKIYLEIYPNEDATNIQENISNKLQINEYQTFPVTQIKQLINNTPDISM